MNSYRYRYYRTVFHQKDQFRCQGGLAIIIANRYPGTSITGDCGDATMELLSRAFEQFGLKTVLKKDLPGGQGGQDTLTFIESTINENFSNTFLCKLDDLCVRYEKVQQ